MPDTKANRPGHLTPLLGGDLETQLSTLLPPEYRAHASKLKTYAENILRLHPQAVHHPKACKEAMIAFAQRCAANGMVRVDIDAFIDDINGQPEEISQLIDNTELHKRYPWLYALTLAIK